MSGPGFRWAPAEIRGVEWGERVAQLHGTLTVVDEYHGTRVYVAHLPDGPIAEYYLPYVNALDACAVPASDDAYALLADGRIVQAARGLEVAPIYRSQAGFENGSFLALSPDGSTIALLHKPQGTDSSARGGYDLSLIDVASGRYSLLRGSLGSCRPCWAQDGRSVFAVEPAGNILQCSLVPEERGRTVAQGRFPFLSEDGSWLMFLPSTAPYREWNGVDWIYTAALMRWKIGTSEQPEELGQVTSSSQGALAVSKEGWIVHGSAPEERLPLEHSGFLMRGPYWRGGIAVTDPATGTTEPLFVGIAPHSVQWRWD